MLKDMEKNLSDLKKRRDNALLKLQTDIDEAKKVSDLQLAKVRYDAIKASYDYHIKALSDALEEVKKKSIEHEMRISACS
jgi:3-dehydroquinate dehydratase